PLDRPLRFLCLLLLNPRVARPAPHPGNVRRLRQFPDQRVLAPAGTDDQKVHGGGIESGNRTLRKRNLLRRKNKLRRHRLSHFTGVSSAPAQFASDATAHRFSKPSVSSELTRSFSASTQASSVSGLSGSLSQQSSSACCRTIPMVMPGLHGSR